MAKKKGSPNQLDEILNKIKTQDSLDSLNDKEIAILQSAFLIEGQREKVFNTLYYDYEKPEYEIMSPAARNWLLPFWNVKQDDNKVSLCGFVEEVWPNMSPF